MVNEYLMVGEIVKPQGIRGEVKLKPITFDVSRFEGMEHALVKRGEAYESISLRVNRIEADAVFMTISGVNDRDAAEKWRGVPLYVDRENAVALPEDANFICDLIGLTATDDEGREIGKLVDVMQPGAGDVYVFKGPMGEVMMPALKSVVLSVDVRKRTMLLSAKRLNEVAVFED